MKEVKFRGLRKEDREWVYGCYQNDVIGEGFHTIIYADSENRYCEDAVYAITVGQYTGIKDRRGLEIYEGDVVNVSEEYGGYAYSPLMVDFKDGCFVLRKTRYSGNYSPMFNYDFTQAYEIIGNIHEDRRLLEN